jgi:hypothetical protein
MADLAKVSLFLRRLGLTFLLTGLMVCLIAPFNSDVAGILWLPCWIALFLAWPYLDLPVFKRRKPRPKLPTAWGRVVVTGLVAFGVSMGIVLLPVSDVLTLSAPLIWLALYYGGRPTIGPIRGVRILRSRQASGVAVWQRLEGQAAAFASVIA